MIFMEDDFLLKDDILKQNQLDFHLTPQNLIPHKQLPILVVPCTFLFFDGSPKVGHH